LSGVQFFVLLLLLTLTSPMALSTPIKTLVAGNVPTIASSIFTTSIDATPMIARISTATTLPMVATMLAAT
jgi:hypothetical protein